jgi:hypothetical protein
VYVFWRGIDSVGEQLTGIDVIPPRPAELAAGSILLLSQPYALMLINKPRMIVQVELSFRDGAQAGALLAR